MSSDSSRYRFPSACPNCLRRFIADWSNIGDIGTCKCGHRFRIEGPAIATLNAAHSETRRCPGCGTAVICSTANPVGQHICCCCGSAFRPHPLNSSAPHAAPIAVPDPSELPPPTASPITWTGVNPTPPDRTLVSPHGIPEPDDALDLPDLPVDVSAPDSENDFGCSDPADLPTHWPVSASQHRVDSDATKQGATLVYRCSRCGSFTAADRLALIGVPDSVRCAACGEEAAFHSSGDVGMVFGDARLTYCRCSHCGTHFAASGLREGGTVHCPRCSQTFPSPQRYVAPALPHSSSPPSTAAYTYRPVPVRSFLRKNGTWVSGYRRSRPKKRR